MKQSKDIKKRIIGVTGGSGAGKSVFSECLSALGAAVVDADRIARAVSKKGGSAYGETVEYFGSEIVGADGEIDRKKLGGIVFSDSEKLERLNEITHKHIFNEMKKEMENAKEAVVVLDVPLLFSSDFPFECDVTVAVIADREKRIERIIKRDGISREAAESRINSQLTNDELKELADVCVENNGDIEEVRASARKIYDSVTKNNRED